MESKVIEENYYFIEGFDESILKINDLISQFNYQFEKFSLKEFEKKFYKFFNLSEDYEKNLSTLYDGEEQLIYEVSQKFEDAIRDSSLINHQDFFNFGYIILLKDNNLIDDLKNILDESNNIFATMPFSIDISPPSSIQILIKILRLFKFGKIRIISHFRFYVTTDFDWSNSSVYNVSSNIKEQDRYVIENSDLKLLEQYINFDLTPFPFIRLAFDSFNESYDIENDKLKFVMLIIALESIFNMGNQGIAHNISRHTSLLLCDNKEDFENMYKTIKDLYRLRNLIVHGTTKESEVSAIDKNLKGNLRLLEEFVRGVLNTLIWIFDFKNINPSKKALFNFLNAKGFEK